MFYPGKAIKSLRKSKVRNVCLIFSCGQSDKPSLILEENAIFRPGKKKFIALSPSILVPLSSPFEYNLLRFFHLFSPSRFEWRILICIMSKTLSKIVAYNNRSSHHFSEGPLKPPNISFKLRHSNTLAISTRKPASKHKPSSVLTPIQYH